jgi:hypothetical protein
VEGGLKDVSRILGDWNINVLGDQEKDKEGKYTA